MLKEYITVESHVAVASPSDRRKGESIINRYEKLYQSNKDFKEYVDSYMKNKNVTLSYVLGLKITQMVADEYERKQRNDRG